MTALQKATLDEIRQAAARICRDYLTGRWKRVTAEQLVVKRISGGLSNFLYYVSLPETEQDDPADGSTSSEPDSDGNGNGNDNKRLRTEENIGEGLIIAANNAAVSPLCDKQPREVLLRVYGQTHGDDALESMITESVVFALLSERNFGPKLYGIFPGGRIEQYIQARPLATLELSNHRISMKIAEKMGEIHSLDIPMSKEPDWLWNCMRRWLKSTSSILQRTNWNEYQTQAEIMRSIDYNAEAKWLRSLIESASFKVLFCHNDMQEGNILLREADAQDSISDLRSSFEDSVIDGTDDDAEGGSFSLRDNGNVSVDPDLKIIDFEYCAYNYRGFDLANHFLEWTFDYTNPIFPHFYHHKHQYPTQEQRSDFIAAYLRKLHEHNMSDGGAYEPSRSELDGVEQEVRIFTMFSHLFWSLWSIVNTTSNIEFGYWDYAVSRVREYQLLKAEYCRAYLGK